MLYGRLVGVIVVMWGAVSLTAQAADISRKLVIELDPLAPSSALIDEKEGFVSSKWGLSADFNVASRVVTGPDLWVGTFTEKGPNSADAETRREDMRFGEKHRIEATRLRWTVGVFEQPRSMRGWFVRGGYSYTSIDSRANRWADEDSQTLVSPDEKVDLVTDLRHSAVIAFGQRWAFFDNRASVTLGLSYEQIVKRTVNVDSEDQFARRDYDNLIEDIPDTRLSTRNMPEAHFGVGYIW